MLWPTSTWPSAVAGELATTSLQRPSIAAPASGVRGSYQISSTEQANNASGSTSAPSAAPSSSSISQGIAAAVRSR